MTNDGATILKAIGIDNPAAKVLVNMSRVQDDEVGDGTTSVTVLASELIREAERLIEMRIHPQTIVAGNFKAYICPAKVPLISLFFSLGWRMATEVARKALEDASADNGENADKFREDLINIAKTTLSSKILSQHKEFFAKMAVDAILRIKKAGKTANLDTIQVTRVLGGTLEDSFLDEGMN